MRLSRLLVVLSLGALALVGLPATPAHAADTSLTFINFDSDTPGPRSNPFTSVDDVRVQFNSTNDAGNAPCGSNPSGCLGQDLVLGNFEPQSRGQGLAVFPDNADALRMQFKIGGVLRPTNRLQLSFGNDDPTVAQDGDVAVLRLFRGSNLKATKVVRLNNNDLMDQTVIQDQGPLFDQATFVYARPNGLGGYSPINLIETVDDVRLNPLCSIAGTEGRDNLSGTAGNDVIWGDAGNDNINGLGGADYISAGTGEDLVDGGAGNDIVYGGLGNDLVNGGIGNDQLYGLAGADRLDGGGGTDRCEGGAGTDTLLASCEVSVQ